jgi:transposase-like protein
LKKNKSPFKWRHFEPSIILLCVRRYCRYQLSFRDVEEMMRERGLLVDHTTVWRWVQRYAPEINKRMRPHLKMSGTSYRLDETYVKVGTGWKYLYRAVRRRWRAMQCFRSFHAAERTLEGIESMHIMKKGQVKRLEGRDTAGQARFVEGLFGVAA